MNKWITICAASLIVAGCFDNKGKPEDVPTAIGLATLMATNRAGIVRVILRGDKAAIPADALSGLDSIRMIDLSERETKDVPKEVLALKGIKEFYFVRNGMESIPDLGGWADTLDYLNLDGNAIGEIPASVGGLVRLKWLRLNGNRIKELPASLATLKDLRRIYLKQNELSAVPEVMKEWTELEDVSLDENPIASVPDWMVAMPNLRRVSLNGTRITRLPADLKPWRRLDLLALGGCHVPADEMRRIRKELPDVAIVF